MKPKVFLATRTAPSTTSTTYAFVAHPDLRGLYIRTHACVVERGCDYCGAERGVPCRGKHGKWLSDVHYTRKKRRPLES